ncbi:hypothetical protein B0J14DRAFT_655542 [Halenospora varia]|nr:hypothetical protein B0J14DRAFT_655542 [Halenospora varia]
MKLTIFLSTFTAAATAVALINNRSRPTTTTSLSSLIPTYTSPRAEATSTVNEPTANIISSAVELEEKKGGGRGGGGGGKGGGRGGKGGGTVIVADPASDVAGLSPENPILILASMSCLIWIIF